MSKSPKSSRAKAVARTAGSATLALTAVAALTGAAGYQPGVDPVALASTIADSAPQLVPAAIPAPMPAPAPLPVLPPPPPLAPSYPDTLDGWIHQALDIMSAHGIPGSYDGIMRNVQRESSGNPRAINLYDSNAAAGIPSKGLLQVIDPTFRAYHVDGTSWDIYDPVANITAACNYAASRYGSMDNVSSSY
ncbi:transglycosylase SLT domain-containing protein [Nocardia sp. NPDC051570]|uniref:transglycosylase SLT domain-containing protein n=1 Tax=Nocardia sp. NPDC051570 TaxID=3364324 RepID=UPI0037B1FCFB